MILFVTLICNTNKSKAALTGKKEHYNVTFLYYALYMIEWIPLGHCTAAHSSLLITVLLSEQCSRPTLLNPCDTKEKATTLPANDKPCSVVMTLQCHDGTTRKWLHLTKQNCV